MGVCIRCLYAKPSSDWGVLQSAGVRTDRRSSRDGLLMAIAALLPLFAVTLLAWNGASIPVGSNSLRVRCYHVVDVEMVDVGLPEKDETIDIRERQSAEKHLVNDAENCGVGADIEGECEDNHECETMRFL